MIKAKSRPYVNKVNIFLTEHISFLLEEIYISSIFLNWAFSLELIIMKISDYLLPVAVSVYYIAISRFLKTCLNMRFIPAVYLQID